MDTLLKILIANPQLLTALIEPLIRAIIEQSAQNPDAFAKFIKSIIDLFDGK